MDLGTFVIHHPKKMLSYFDKAIFEQQDEMVKACDEVESYTKKPKFHARIYNLPVSAELTKGTLPRACDIGRFVSVRGTVIRAGLAKMLEVLLLRFAYTKSGNASTSAACANSNLKKRPNCQVTIPSLHQQNANLVSFLLALRESFQSCRRMRSNAETIKKLKFKSKCTY